MLFAITVWLFVLSVSLDPSETTEMIVALIAGVALGAITGLLIVANTSFRAADVPNAVRVQGSRITFAIWIGAFPIRFLARFLVPHGADPRPQLPLKRRHRRAGRDGVHRNRRGVLSRDRPLP